MGTHQKFTRPMSVAFGVELLWKAGLRANASTMHAGYIDVREYKKAAPLVTLHSSQVVAFLDALG